MQESEQAWLITYLREALPQRPPRAGVVVVRPHGALIFPQSLLVSADKVIE